MIPYNVDFFNPVDFSLRLHANVDAIEYSYDYLSPDSNEIEMMAGNVVKNDYIYIYRGNEKYFGIVTGISSDTPGLYKIRYDDFLSIFKSEILFDTNLQGTGTLEDTIKSLIERYWVNNSDTVQDVFGLSVATTSSTTGWGFNLKSDTENMHHCIVDFYDTIIARALEKYGVRILVTPSPQTKKIVLSVGTCESQDKYIEADLSNIISKNVVIKDTDNTINKLVVYNTENYNASSARAYFLHTDGSYSRTNSDRVTPVKFDITTTAPDKNEEAPKTFEQMADAAAEDFFGKIKYNNLIEIEVLSDDPLVKPDEIEIGQTVKVISDDSIYTSMLTGKKIKAASILLIFGSIRLDLTKRRK